MYYCMTNSLLSLLSLDTVLGTFQDPMHAVSCSKRIAHYENPENRCYGRYCLYVQLYDITKTSKLTKSGLTFSEK
jgi:hypothetical protein